MNRCSTILSNVYELTFMSTNVRLVFIQRWSGIVNHISDEHPCEDLKYQRKVLSGLTGSMVWQYYVVPIKHNVLKMDNDSGVINIVRETDTLYATREEPAHKQLQQRGCFLKVQSCHKNWYEPKKYFDDIR